MMLACEVETRSEENKMWKRVKGFFIKNSYKIFMLVVGHNFDINNWALSKCDPSRTPIANQYRRPFDELTPGPVE